MLLRYNGAHRFLQLLYSYCYCYLVPLEISESSLNLLLTVMYKKKRKVEITIPDALVIEIFSKLPVKSLSRFKCVSKFCLSFIEDPFFIEKTCPKTPLKWQFQDEESLYIYSIDDNGVAALVHTYKFENSTICFKHCDGLICYLDDDFGFCMYNLTTGEGILLPEWCESFELSFDPSSKKYKVLGWKKRRDAEFLDFQILTLEKDLSWRPVSNTIEITSLSEADNAVNGKLFWTTKSLIISFNFVNEEFREIELPDEFSENGYAYSLFEFEGSLCLVEQRRCEEPFFNFWMLKDGDGDIWNVMKRNITLPFEGTNMDDYYYPNSGWTLRDSDFSSRSGEILITASDDEDQYVYFYNILNGQFKLMTITELPFYNFKINNYVENYLCLEELVD